MKKLLFILVMLMFGLNSVAISKQDISAKDQQTIMNVLDKMKNLSEEAEKEGATWDETKWIDVWREVMFIAKEWFSLPQNIIVESNEESIYSAYGKIIEDVAKSSSIGNKVFNDSVVMENLIREAGLCDIYSQGDKKSIKYDYILYGDSVETDIEPNFDELELLVDLVERTNANYSKWDTDEWYAAIVDIYYLNSFIHKEKETFEDVLKKKNCSEEELNSIIGFYEDKCAEADELMNNFMKVAKSSEKGKAILEDSEFMKIIIENIDSELKKVEFFITN